LDGGANWSLVPGNNIPNPVSNEYGVVGYYSAIGDRAWFGTSQGRVYRTLDKGRHWDVSSTSLISKFVDVAFADSLHGIAQDRNQNATGNLSETFDGGISWNAITLVGQVGPYEICFVPGSGNSWVSTAAGSLKGAFYSLDGGHSWASFNGTDKGQFLSVTFLNQSNGWAGSFSSKTGEEGVFKFLGLMPSASVLNPVSGLLVSVDNRNVHLTWNAPASGIISGYNVYRNNTLLNTIPVVSPVYDDLSLPDGQYTYCIKVVYGAGESGGVCTTLSIPFLGPVTSLNATVSGRSVHLEWVAPVSGSVLGYYVYRNDTLITYWPVAATNYTDSPVANGSNTYCVKAVYASGESAFVCTAAQIAFGIPEFEAQVRIYPNPALEVIHIETPEDFSQVQLFTLIGQEVYNYKAPGKSLRILTAGFKPGLYILKIHAGNSVHSGKISIR